MQICGSCPLSPRLFFAEIGEMTNHPPPECPTLFSRSHAEKSSAARLMHSWSSPAKTILRYTPSSSRGQLPIPTCGRRACVSPKTAANAPSGAATRMVAARRGFPSGDLRRRRRAPARVQHFRQLRQISLSGAASAPHSPEPAECGTGGRKNAFPVALGGAQRAAPCPVPLGNSPPRRRRTPRRGPGGRGRRRTRPRELREKRPSTGLEYPGGLSPARPLCAPSAPPPKIAVSGGIRGRSPARPGHSPAGRRRPRRKMPQSAPSIFPRSPGETQ